MTWNVVRPEPFFRLAFLLTLFLFPGAAVAGEPAGPGKAAAPVEPAEVAGHLGQYATLNSDKGAELGVEVRLHPRHFHWQPHWLPDMEPQTGLMMTAKGSLYAYGGFGFDIDLGKDWEFRPSWGVGLFHDNDERDLGGAVQFRSALELSKRVGSRIRLGLTFYHLSNAGLFDRNPGVESLVLTFAARP
jgi:hypothetical protein